jgi:hypothetical protein
MDLSMRFQGIGDLLGSIISAKIRKDKFLVYAGHDVTVPAERFFFGAG